MTNGTKSLLVAGLLLGTLTSARADVPLQPDAARIQHELDGLGTVGTVLYVAAHPDDENTRLLSYLANARHLRTVYLSMTRGDGGQNLIGDEQDALFGLIRTRELLEARRIDRAEQLFTRARDFGFSKSPDETLAIWGHDEALADVVWAIRRVRPDVILTRFSSARSQTHGHHTASAMLAAEAFEAAADPARFPEQLEHVAPWQADRLIYNVSSWTITPETDTSAWLKLDVGGYDPLLGTSYGEMAGLSRSMHKSQGFGAAQQRGPILEYFEPLAGTRPVGDIFDGLDLTWGRVAGSDALSEAVRALSTGFDLRKPAASVPGLLRARTLAAALPDDPWRAHTLAHIDALIAACTGLHLEALADRYEATPGEALAVSAEASNRSDVPMRLVSLRLPDGTVVPVDRALAHNEPLIVKASARIPADAPLSAPYWLREPLDGGRYRVSDPLLVGLPEDPPALPVTFMVEVGEETLEWVRDLAFKWVDPVEGEQVRPFEITAPATVAFDREALLFPDRAPRTVRVVVRAGRKDLRGTLRLELPEGWTAEPTALPMALTTVGEERAVRFTVSPPSGTGPLDPRSGGPVRAVVDVDSRAWAWSVSRIEYPHIPIQTVHSEAEIPLVPFELARKSERIGYVPGPGDKVAESLREAGYQVDVISDEALTSGDLDAWRSIVVGVRAYSNTPRIKVWQPRLLEWVERGGTLVVQYATKNHLSDLLAPIGPRPLVVGRGRVTDEAAPVTFADPASPLLNSPNTLTNSDFDGWVQERGLYFAESWDPAWKPALTMADPGEKPQDGALLALDHGKGRVVYTGLAFFRQLPAGVPGAFRLLANLIDHAH